MQTMKFGKHKSAHISLFPFDQLSRLLLGCLLLFSGSLAYSGETLSNGIVLPDDWPPKRTLEELRSGEPMDVPYLKNPPAVIPIDLGRQLLVDDFLIEQTNLKRQFYKGQFYTNNPVLRPDRVWERIFYGQHTAMSYSDGVFYDPQDKIFKMWYLSAPFGDTAYATSPDGIHWTKPNLDVLPRLNIVLLSGQRDSAVIWLDLETNDPKQRYKTFQFSLDCGRPSLHVSADGIHWSGPTWCEETGDRSTMFYNPFRKVWVFSLRDCLYAPPHKVHDYECVPPKPLGRSSRYWETRDFLNGATWKTYDFGATNVTAGEPTPWCASDKLDNPANTGTNDLKAEIYGMDAVGYESLMLGLFSVLHEPKPSLPKINDIMLGFSRDGFHWDRPFREAVIPVAEKTEGNPWNLGNVQSVGGGCLVMGDKLYMYCSGRNNGSNTTGLAFFRRDGFASMDAGTTEGTLTTRPLTFKGKRLFVNLAAPGGELRVEVLDKDGKVIAPFSKENCEAVSGDKTLQVVTWKGAKDLAAIAGKPVRFRFHLKNGSLYSFWVSPDESGASHGYVAAGGPGFTGPTDTVGIGVYPEVEKIMPTNLKVQEQNHTLAVFPLKNTWKFKPDPKNAGQKEGWASPAVKDGDWADVRSDTGTGWESQGFPDYTGYGWYRQTLRLPPEILARKYLYIIFGAVDEDAEIFLNGKLVFSHTCESQKLTPNEIWTKPFLFDARPTGLLKADTNILLAVRVYNSGGMGGVWKPAAVVGVDRPVTVEVLFEYLTGKEGWK